MTNKPRKTKQVTLKVVGLILSESYQRCKLFSEKLHKHHNHKFHPPYIKGMLDMDWVEYLEGLRKELGGKTWAVKESVVVFLNNSFLGGEEELFSHFKNYLYQKPTAEKVKELAKKEYLSYLNHNNLLYTYMELSLDGEFMGTLLFQLRCDLLPRTSIWFVEMCGSKSRFTYQGTKVHRVCRRGWFQAGKVKAPLNNYLEDENYSYKHDRRGILSFANDGKHTNQTQFFVTFAPAAWMDGRYVAFGRLVEGADVLRRIENTPCTYERPDKEITITECHLANVGFGRGFDPNLRLKGITIGEPHYHFDFFIDLIFEKFTEILYQRLDEEMKIQIRGEWMMEMLWERVIQDLSKRRPPVEDWVDEKDKSSQTYLSVRYFAGLYGLQEIPDHFIMSLLNEVIDQVIDRCDIRSIAHSIISSILGNVFQYASASEDAAEEVIKQLMKKVFRIVFGSEASSVMDFSKSELILSSLKEVLSAAPDLKSSLAEFRKMVGFEEEVVEEPKPPGDLLSTKESLAAYMWSLLLEAMQNMDVPQE